MNYAKAMELVMEHKSTKLGSVFIKGMTQNLQDWVKNPGDADMTSFYASLSYFYLKGLIQNREVVRDIFGVLMEEHSADKALGSVVGNISKILLGELLKKCHCNSVDELVMNLNEMSVPNWFFEWGKDLALKICEGLFQYNGSIYYLTEDKRFMRLEVPFAGVRGTLDEPMMDHEEIGKGFETLFGFDETNKLAYLETVRQEGFYQVYDVRSKTFFVRTGQMLTVNKNVPYIYKDGFIASICGDEVQNIRKTKENEGVICKNDCFRIAPADNRKPIFLPYCLHFDGTISADDKDYCRSYIWNLINAGNELERVLGSASKNYCPDELNIDSVRMACEKELESALDQKKERAVIFEGILDLLAPSISSGEDLTQLLYTLYRCNQLLTRGLFPSDLLYWRIEKLLNVRETVSVFEESLKGHHFENLEELIVGKTIKTDDDELEDGLIGRFEINEDEIQVETFTKENGVVMGSLVIPNGGQSDDKGVVYYDSSLNQYYVSCNSILSDDVQGMLAEAFKLEDCNYVFIVKQMPTTEKSSKKILDRIDKEKAGSELFCNEGFIADDDLLDFDFLLDETI